MRKIITKDNSITFHNKEYDEHYHSITGAEEEAVKKFVEPCNFEDLTTKGTINILDVCFGLGYNSAAAIDMIRKLSKECTINIIGLENDKSILNETKDINTKFNSYNIIKKAARELSAYEDNINITLLIGDARDSIKNISQDFDVVFLDPFSPKKCPELWTEQFFKDIKAMMNKNGVLTTYSCAKIIRMNLAFAGFEVKDGPCIGRKSPSTIAFS